MMRYLLPLIFLFVVGVSAQQEEQKRIGEIGFYGTKGVDLEKLRAALPFHEGETITKRTSAQKFEEAKQVIQQLTGHAPTDIAPSCCDARGDLTIYVGLSGQVMRYLPVPKGKDRFPAEVSQLFNELSKASEAAISRGANGEDTSQGYALSNSYPPLRAIQMRMREYALEHETLIRKVLESSADNDQRAMAADLLGYARQSDAQLSHLVRASRDSDDGVRNNATRALVLLVMSKPALARRIQPSVFIDMLMSGTWLDVNKSSFLLDGLTRGRDAKLLAQLRQPAVIDRLIEIARWRSHAEGARSILGRLAGIDEKRLTQLVAAEQVDEIINALHLTR